MINIQIQIERIQQGICRVHMHVHSAINYYYYNTFRSSSLILFTELCANLFFDLSSPISDMTMDTRYFSVLAISSVWRDK